MFSAAKFLLSMDLEHKGTNSSEGIMTGSDKILKCLQELRKSSRPVKEQQQTFLCDKESLVLDFVSDYLSWTDLKAMRLANSVWSRAATENARRREICVINLKKRYEDPGHAVFKTFIINGRIWTAPLDQLNGCLRESTNFPCVTFRFENVVLEESDLQLFLDMYGCQLKSLSLQMRSSYCSDPESFDKLFLQQVVNLRSLTFKFPTVYHRSIILFGEMAKFKNNQILSNLRSLNIHEGMWTPESNFGVTKILNGAVNLKNIQVVPFVFEKIKLVEALIQTRNIHLLRVLQVELNPFSLDGYEKLIPVGLQLEKIIFDGVLTNDVWPRGITVLKELLKSSRRSLVELKLTRTWTETNYHLRPLEEFNWGGFMGLRKLHLDIPCQNFLQSTINLTFPVLTEVTIMTGDWNFPFPFVGTSQTVKSLDVGESYGIASTWYDKIPIVFPNLENVRWSSEKNVPRFFSRTVFKLTKLQSLTFKMDIGSSRRNSYPGIDSTFTGFTKNTCKQLKKSLPSLSPDEMTALRVKSSLLDLKDLQVLCVHYDGGRYEEVITSLTFAYAFRFLPWLQVVVYDEGNDDGWVRVH